MSIVSESLLKEMLIKTDLEVNLASLFGSYGRRYNTLSDVDILVVCESEDNKPLIIEKLGQMSFRINRPIHINFFTSKEYRNRLRHQDYLLASILDESTFLVGDSESFIEEKRKIFESKASHESIRFNRDMGTEITQYANDCFRKLQCIKATTIFRGEPCQTKKELFLKGIKNYHLGFGYLLASREMMKIGRTVPLRYLLKLENYAFLKDLIVTEKKAKRKSFVNQETINEKLTQTAALNALYSPRRMGSNTLSTHKSV